MDVVADALFRLTSLDEGRRLREIRQAWDAYYGFHPDTFKQDAEAPDDNVVLNYCRLIVDKGVSFLYGQPPVIDVGGGAAQTALDDVLKANRFPLLAKQFALNGAVAGHSYLRIYDPGRADQPIRLLNLDPQTVFPTWESDDYQNVHTWRLQWNAVEDDEAFAYRTRMVRNDARTAWEIVDERTRGDAEGASEAVRWEEIGRSIWPFPFSPIVDCQNLPVPNEYFGEPDLPVELIDLNHRLNGLASNMAKMVRLFAHPRPWLKGVAPGADGIDVAPDVAWHLPPNAEAGVLQYDASLTSAIDLYEKLKDAFHEKARVPRIATGKVEDIGPMAGIALQILYQPLIEKTEDKQGTHEPMLEDLAQRILAVKRVAGDPTASVDWPELLPIDPVQEAQAFMLDMQLGASKKTILARRGYDPDVEAAQKADEDAAAAEIMARAFDAGPNAGAATE